MFNLSATAEDLNLHRQGTIGDRLRRSAPGLLREILNVDTIERRRRDCDLHGAVPRSVFDRHDVFEFAILGAV